MNSDANSDADSDADADSDSHTEVQVDFDFFPPSSIDYHATKRLLEQLFGLDGENLDLGAAADTLIGQTRVGTMVKVDGVDGDPYAVNTVLRFDEGVLAECDCVSGAVLFMSMLSLMFLLERCSASSPTTCCIFVHSIFVHSQHQVPGKNPLVHRDKSTRDTPSRGQHRRAHAQRASNGRACRLACQ